MDLDKFLSSLEQDYKELLLAIAIMYPLAFFDCWTFYPDFKTIELYPQVVIPIAVSVAFASLGLGNIVLCELVQCRFDLTSMDFHISALLASGCFVGASTSVILSSRPSFVGFWVTYAAGFLSLALLAFFFRSQSSASGDRDCHGDGGGSVEGKDED